MQNTPFIKENPKYKIMSVTLRAVFLKLNQTEPVGVKNNRSKDVKLLWNVGLKWKKPNRINNLLLLLIQDLPPNRKAMRNLIDNRNKSMCVLKLNKGKLMTTNPLDLPHHPLTKLKHKRRNKNVQQVKEILQTQNQNVKTLYQKNDPFINLLFQVQQ